MARCESDCDLAEMVRNLAILQKLFQFVVQVQRYLFFKVVFSSEREAHGKGTMYLLQSDGNLVSPVAKLFLQFFT